MSSVEQIWSLDDLPVPGVLRVIRPTRLDSTELRLAPQRLREQQAELIMPQFREAFDDPLPLKYKNGPHIDELIKITAMTNAEFNQLGDLDPELLYPEDYRQGKISESDLSTEASIALADVKWNRRTRLTLRAANGILNPKRLSYLLARLIFPRIGDRAITS